MAMTADEVRASKRAFMARKRAEDPEAARKEAEAMCEWPLRAIRRRER